MRPRLENAQVINITHVRALHRGRRRLVFCPGWRTPHRLRPLSPATQATVRARKICMSTGSEEGYKSCDF